MNEHRTAPVNPPPGQGAATITLPFPTNTLNGDQAAVVRAMLRGGLLGTYAVEVDDLRAWHASPDSTAFGRAKLAEQREQAA